MKLKLVLLFLTLTTAIYCQATRVTDFSIMHYSIDHFTGEIYVRSYYDGLVYKLNASTGNVSSTDFISLPVFANKSHKAAYADYDKNTAFLYDFETKTTTAFPEGIFAPYWPRASFSPNDKKIVINDYVYDFSTRKYYFDNNLINTLDEKVVWSSDSSAIITDDFNLIEYYPDSKRKDTLIFSDEMYHYILDFSYSSSYDKIYYGLTYLGVPPDTILPDMRLHVYDRKDRTTKQLYSFRFSEKNLYLSMHCQSLSWSPGEKLLGFLGVFNTQSDADLYVYHPDSNKVFRLTDIHSNFGVKSSLKWYDDKTFYYIDMNTHCLYKYNVPQRVTSVKKENSSPDNFYLSNYPNPFNSSTIIDFSVPENCKAELKIYNNLGQLVKDYSIREVRPNNVVKISWNGTDDFGNKVSSGIYYALLRTSLDKESSSKTIKLLLLK